MTRKTNAPVGVRGVTGKNTFSDPSITQFCRECCPILGPEWESLRSRRAREIAISYFWRGVGFGLEQAERRTPEEGTP